MKLLPDPGPQRRRLFLMIGAAVVLYVGLSQYAGSEPLPIPKTTGPEPTSKPPVTLRGPNTRTTGARKEATMPQPLKLEEFNQVPDEPEAGRNLFRFGVKPLPPAPKPTPTPTPVYTPPPQPPVPQIPPIPLKLTSVLVDPDVPGRLRAYLSHKDTGVVFEATQGQIVDGRYKLLAVGASSVVMCYLDGTGQRTITLGGG